MDATPRPWSSVLRRRPERRGRALLALGLALLFHLLFAGFLLLLSVVHVKFPGDREPPPPRQAVSLRTLNAQQWAQNRAARPRSENESSHASPPEPKRPEEKKPQVPKGQVVDVAPGNDQKAPDAKYLAEKSNKVQKESKSRQTSAFYRNAMPRQTTPTPQQTPGKDAVEKAQLAGNNGLGTDDRPLRQAGEKKKLFEVPDVKRQSQVAMKEPPTQKGPGAEVANHAEREAVHGNSARMKMQDGAEGGSSEEASEGHRGAPGTLNLMPSASVLDKIAGAAPNDHLADVDEGEGTFLNTKEWKFASFFNRVKQSVGMHWDPGQELRQRDPTANIYGGKDRYTILNITLTERGMVKEIHVEKSCGIDFLDSEAILAFQRSQPFPNPPPGLVGSDQAIHFSFGFFLEMGGGPRMRLFRAPN